MVRPRITAIGGSNIDLIMQLPHLPAAGQTVSDGRFTRAPGGKGANQAVAAARAGGEVTFVTCLGNDPYAPEMKAGFAADGIDTRFIVDDGNQPSGTALIMFDGAGTNYIAVAPGANDTLSARHVREAEPAVAASAAVLLQMEAPVETNREALRIAERHGVRVVFNYAPTRGGPLEIGPAMSVLVVNETEAAELTGRASVDAADAAEAAHALRARGPAAVVLTLGGEGVWVVADQIDQLIPARRVDPVDTTAAGDTFCGALAVALGEGRPIRDAVSFANAAAALSVQRVGAQPSIPDRPAIEAMFPGQADAGPAPS